MPKKSKAKLSKAAEAPAVCTFACPHSDFPPPDSAGICRTMAAVHCRKLNKLVEKNLPCRWQSGRGN